MRRINPPVPVTIRRHGFKVRTISRLTFEAGPEIAGWVNHLGKVYPVFRDPKGGLYLNEDGWVSTRRYPLTAERDVPRAMPRLKF